MFYKMVTYEVTDSDIMADGTYHPLGNLTWKHTNNRFILENLTTHGDWRIRDQENGRVVAIWNDREPKKLRKHKFTPPPDNWLIIVEEKPGDFEPKLSQTMRCERKVHHNP